MIYYIQRLIFLMKFAEKNQKFIFIKNNDDKSDINVIINTKV